MIRSNHGNEMGVLLDESSRQKSFTQKFRSASLRTVRGLFRFRALAVGSVTTILILIIISFFVDFRVFGNGDGSYPCWDSHKPLSYIDPKHRHGYRTLIPSSIDSNYLVIKGRNHPSHKKSNNHKKSNHKHSSSQVETASDLVAATQPTFTIHAQLVSANIIVADFSPIGGAPALHGNCLSNGNIRWSDGNIWAKGVRMSELIQTTNHLAQLAGSKIRQVHDLHIKEQNEKNVALSDSVVKRERSSSVTSADSTVVSLKDGVHQSSTVEGEEYSSIKAYTDEGVAEPVTMADLASNDVFVKGLRYRFPGLAIFTEEQVENEEGLSEQGLRENDHIYSTVLASNEELITQLDADPIFPITDLLITIDPLDATKEFTEELLQYVTTQQCVLYNGKPILGVIHQPFNNKPPTLALPTLQQVFGEYEKGQGNKGGGDNTVIMSRSHNGGADQMVTDLFEGKTSFKAGGAGYKALEVKLGHAEAYLHATKSKIWDVCAPHALLTANGGVFTDTTGKDIVYDPKEPVLLSGFLGTTSPSLHKWYLTRMQGHAVHLQSSEGVSSSPPISQEEKAAATAPSSILDQSRFEKKAASLVSFDQSITSKQQVKGATFLKGAKRE